MREEPGVLERRPTLDAGDAKPIGCHKGRARRGDGGAAYLLHIGSALACQVGLDVTRELDEVLETLG